ncbi:MAG: transglutaminase-like domain-containing protein [candidate division WOR-3 bacterium]|nr:transglutaminase-like domain-containing protein [candidate division WOR-3 bacterium]MCX7837501.1 transglutaminase-like domain-containing protein [candidate division WOR-3 bacterium]MDW8113392.1 transglutaminase-like domain-containing protein [candidate division WOR-3 bacterium]
MNQTKIGYSLSKINVGDSIIKFYNRIKIKLKVGKELKEVMASTFLITDLNLKLKNFETEQISGKNIFKISGKVKKDTLYYSWQIGSEVNENCLILPSNTYPAGILPYLIISQNLKNWKGNLLDLTLFSILPAEIKFQKKDTIIINDTIYPVWVYEVEMGKVKSIYYLDSLGNLLKEISAANIIGIKESPQKAIAEWNKDFLDILSFFSIPIDTSLSEPTKLKSLKLEIQGIESFEYLDLELPNQKIISKKPLIIEITKPKLIETKYLKISEKEKIYLQSTPTIQSDHSLIKKKALEIIGNLSDPKAIAEKILIWVFRNLKKKATTSYPSAIEILKNLEGDCNEHATLYTAFCRALGIPARVVVGLVYAGNSFYYHAWNQVYLNEWISCDPTFGEFPASPAHLILKVGDVEEQVKVLSIVGNIKIKVLSFEYE